jgi:hypothetical protein
VLPLLLVGTTKFWRQLYEEMQWVRFALMMFLLLMMLLLPIKMLGIWTLGLKYLVAIPEWSFNL